MKNIFAFILLIFSAMQMLNGDKRLLISDPQYAQNIVQAFDVKLEKLNQHVVQQDNIISSLQKNMTVQEAITRHQFNETNVQEAITRHQLNETNVQEAITRHQLNETNIRLEDSNHRLQLQEQKYQQTVQKLEAQEAINHVLLSRLSTQESLNTKLTQDLDIKNKELNQQFSNDTKGLTSQLSALNNTVTQLSSKETILSQQLLNQSNQLNHLQTLASTSQPAFHVALRTPVTVPDGGKVIFQNKLLDIGNGYNVQTGIYTVARSGTYVITWTISVLGKYVCYTHLMVNSSDKGATTTDGRDAGSDNEVATRIVVLRLVVGDQLYIRQHGDSLCRMVQDSYRQTSFSGWFLHE